MKKILVSLAVALTFSAATYAQSPLQFGVQAGLNLSSITWEDMDDDVSSKIGFNIGVTADYALSEALFLQPALMYTTKGADLGNDVTANLGYLELPINIGYKIPLESFTVSLKAGPYLAYGLSAKLKADVDGGSGEIDLYEKNEDAWGIDKAPLKKFDYGVGIGAGVEFGQIAVGLAYELGLANLANYDDGKIKNSNAMLTVGYKF